MATAKKSAGGRKAPSKAAASKGGRASSGGASKKSSGSARGGATSKATALKKAASKSAAGSRGVAKKVTASKGVAKKATASRSSAAAARSGSSARGASARGGAAKKAASKSASSRGASARGGATASRGRAAASKGSAAAGRNPRTGRGSAAASRGRGGQQSSDPRNDLEKLMVDGLKDIYYAEKALSKALARMAKSATNEELRAAFETHREETDEQVRMLEGAFQTLGQKVQGKKCYAMDGLIEEGKEHMTEASKGPGRDAVMIVSAQKAEHYEIAAYGSLRTFAQSLGNTEVAQVFQTILDQESATDEKLTGIAETVNRMALGAHNDTKGGNGGGEGGSGSEQGASGSGSGESSENGNGRSDVAPIPAETLDITA